MATKKKTVNSSDEKFENIDIKLFDVLDAIDRKDYGYYDKLTEEQKKKVSIFMLTKWTSAIKSNAGMQRYYVESTDYHANKYMFNEHVSKHPTLQWMLLCASSAGSKHYHQWIPQIKESVSALKTNADRKDIYEYFSKIYPGVGPELWNEFATEFVKEHKKKLYIAQQYPNLKHADIETLSLIITDEQIKEYERDKGN